MKLEEKGGGAFFKKVEFPLEPFPFPPQANGSEPFPFPIYLIFGHLLCILQALHQNYRYAAKQQIAGS